MATTGTELAKAYVQIVPSMQGIKGQLSKQLGSEGDAAGKIAGNGLVSRIKGIIAAAGLGKMLSHALTAGGELEQNLGGTEAVFGAFADTIKSKASSAYKNMGLSASDYMATANKMGSLFQGSGVEQQKSLDLTTKAMQRATDVASVMGLDTSMAMESIAGAAKGNFTMMDNLGVAMNATTLEAYALEKGINFKWKTASNAKKAELAMQMFFERTEQYAGNFAKESEQTLLGSMGAVKAAFKDVIGNLALGNDIKPSLNALCSTVVTFVGGNLLPAIGNIIGTLPMAVFSAIQNMLPGLAPKLLTLVVGLVTQISTSLPTMLGEFITIIVHQFIPQLLSGLQTALPQLLTAGASLLHGLVNGLISALPELITVIPSIVESIVTTLTDNIPVVLDTGIQLLHAILDAIPLIVPELVKALPQIITAIVNGLLTAIPQIISAAWQIVTAFGQALYELLPDNLKGVVDSIGGAFREAWDVIKIVWDTVRPYFQIIWEGIKGIFSVVSASLGAYFKSAWEVIKAIWNVATSYFKAIWDTIAAIFSVVKSVLKGDFQGAWDAIKGIVSTWASYFSGVWKTIMNVFSNVASYFGDAFRRAWNAVKSAFSSATSYFKTLLSNIIGIFGNIGSSFLSVGRNLVQGLWQGISNSYSWIRSKIRGWVGDVLSFIKNLFGIHSPSTEMAWVGKMNVLGLAKGMEDNTGAVKSAIDDITRMTTGTLRSDFAVSTSMEVNPASGTNDDKIDRLIALLLLIIEKLDGMGVYLDSDKLVGELLTDIDKKLGQRRTKTARGTA